MRNSQLDISIPDKLSDRIESKLKILNEARPLSGDVLLRLKEEFKLQTTYNSNAIEGNSLTLRETPCVIG